MIHCVQFCASRRLINAHEFDRPLPAAAGVLPFGTIFIELYFAMTSIWLGYFYYLFGFVFLIGLLSVVINAEISVLCTYVQLCAEDYSWW